MIRGVIGVVHVPAMPGDPAYERGGFEGALAWAARDAAAIAAGGAQAIVVENFGSAPFPKGTPEEPTPPQAIAALALAVHEAKRHGLPVGVNVLRNDVKSALGIAAATGAAFVRVNIHMGAYVTDQGVIEGRAYETLRYRDAIGARGVAIFADVRVKHAAPLAPRSIEAEVSDLVKRGLADAVIVTGEGTGAPVASDELERVRAAASGARVVIGSGLDEASAPRLSKLADAAIVGTWIKEDGDVRRPVDPARVARLVRAWTA